MAATAKEPAKTPLEKIEMIAQRSLSKKKEELKDFKYFIPKVKYGTESHEYAQVIFKRGRGRGDNWKIEKIINLSRKTKIKGLD